LFSANPSETIITTVQYLFDAMKAGAKLTVIDPMFSVTAAKADKWIPINPGVDSALMLAMISEIIDNEWYDEEYMLANTVSPYLIDEKTGAFIRQNAEVSEEDTYETNPFMVWDTLSNQAVPATSESISAALEGAFTLPSGKAKTVFTLLKENQKPYTSDWASPITGVPVEDIVELARAYACDGPALITSGWGGSDKVCNSDVNGHAMSLLASITGNVGVHGGGVGIMGEQMISHGSFAEFGGWTLPEEFATAELEMSFTARREEPNKARVLINSGNVTQQHTGNLTKTNEWLKTLDFIVTIVPFYNEGTKWSDIVLPACTNFETEYDYSRLITFRNHVLIQQKVVDPLYESKSDFAIEQELAKLFKLEQYLPKSPTELLEATLTSEDPKLAGITLEALTKNNGIMRMNVPEEPFVGHLDQVYETPTGKLEYYHEISFADNQALPNYAEPNEIAPNNELAEKYPLSFVQRHTRFHVHSQFMESAWIREIDPEPVIELSEKDAEARGLKNGDTVEVFNDRGSCKVKVKIMNTMRPGTSSIHEGWYSGKMIEGHLQNLTNDYQEERQKVMTYGPVVPYNDTRVEVKKV
jgi:molybdopterin-containing oxidoreductase family molybdopterin binding subunit